MSEAETAMEQALQVTIREIKSMNGQIKKELKKDAPETTRIKPIYFGNPRIIPDRYTFGKDLGYEEYLGALLTSYINYKTQEKISSPYKNYLEANNPLTGEEYSFDWEETRKGHGGILWNDQFIFIESLPHSELRKIENELRSELPEDGLKNHLVKFIRASVIRFHSEEADYRNVNYRTLKHTISHELTHDYIKNNSKIGQLRDYAESKEVLNDTDLERMMFPEDQEGLIPVKSQVKQISKNTTLLTIEEMFAFFVANHYVERGAPRKPKAFEAYEKPQEIAWGIQILEERSSQIEGSVVDWAREESVEIFSHIAKVGQVKDPSGRRKPEAVFLRKMLPGREKQRLERFKKICEGDLSTAFTDLHRALEQLDNQRHAPLHDIRSLEQRIDWKNPAHIEDIVIHESAEEAVERKLSLGETADLFRKNMKGEVERLREYIAYTTQLEDDLDPSQKAKMEEVLSEIKHADQEIEELM
ncbi:MAG: hypothetical protein J07AB43_15130 [Candidatus Nanosalina sp. J07AB43]|nr:MAG: hypothetical protein J07AB43_15130 [Candidatus Nanosalina sp. J07AB43]